MKPAIGRKPKRWPASLTHKSKESTNKVSDYDETYHFVLLRHFVRCTTMRMHADLMWNRRTAILSDMKVCGNGIEMLRPGQYRISRRVVVRQKWQLVCQPTTFRFLGTFSIGSPVWTAQRVADRLCERIPWRNGTGNMPESWTRKEGLWTSWKRFSKSKDCLTLTDICSMTRMTMAEVSRKQLQRTELPAGSVEEPSLGRQFASCNRNGYRQHSGREYGQHLQSGNGQPARKMECGNQPPGHCFRGRLFRPHAAWGRMYWLSGLFLFRP